MYVCRTQSLCVNNFCWIFVLYRVYHLKYYTTDNLLFMDHLFVYDIMRVQTQEESSQLPWKNF